MLGPVLIGILIGNFSNILYDLTKREKGKVELQDLIAHTMYSLRLPMEIQSRVNEYYDITTESTINYDKEAFSGLNHFLSMKIMMATSK